MPRSRSKCSAYTGCAFRMLAFRCRPPEASHRSRILTFQAEAPIYPRRAGGTASDCDNWSRYTASWEARGSYRVCARCHHLDHSYGKFNTGQRFWVAQEPTVTRDYQSCFIEAPWRRAGVRLHGPARDAWHDCRIRRVWGPCAAPQRGYVAGCPGYRVPPVPTS